VVCFLLLIPLYYMFIAGIAKEDGRSFIGYKKAERTS
jgi:hypothetical protein